MENITVKKHLVIALIFAILILIYSFKSKHKRKLLINLFLGTYIVIIAYIIFYDIYLQYYLNSFDIDKNGFFNGDEITIEQKKAMQKLSSDTGRNFFFFFGLFYSAILSGILYKLVGITKKPNG